VPSEDYNPPGSKFYLFFRNLGFGALSGKVRGMARFRDFGSRIPSSLGIWGAQFGVPDRHFSDHSGTKFWAGPRICQFRGTGGSGRGLPREPWGTPGAPGGVPAGGGAPESGSGTPPIDHFLSAVRDFSLGQVWGDIFPSPVFSTEIFFFFF